MGSFCAHHGVAFPIYEEKARASTLVTWRRYSTAQAGSAMSQMNAKSIQRVFDVSTLSSFCDGGHAAASRPGMRSPHGRLLDQQSRIAIVTKRAAPLKTHSQQACEAGDLAEYGLGGTVGSRGGPPARSRPSAGCKTRSISLGAAVDRTMLVPIDLVPGPIPAVPLLCG